MTAPSVGEPQAPRNRTTLRGRSLVLARAAWLLVVGLAAAFFGAGLPIRYEHLRELSSYSASWTTSAQRAALAELGISADFRAAYLVALAVVLAAGSLGVAGIIVWRRSDDALALFVSGFLVMFGTAMTGATAELVVSEPAWRVPYQVAFAANVIAFFLFGTLFPDGRFVPRWSRLLAVVWVPVILYEIVNDNDDPLRFRHEWLVGPLWLGGWGAAVGAQIFRYVRVSGPIERQQTKWIVYGIAAPVVAMAAGLVIVPALFPAVREPNPGLLYDLVTSPIVILAFLLVPSSVGIAILRHRLWDIDTLISRTLVYGGLSACVLGVYILVVGSLGAVVGAQGGPVVSLLAAGLVAVLFQPLRERLQRSVNHLLYGQRDEPYAVLSRLGQRLETTLAPEALLPVIAETIAQALKLQYVAIALDQNGTRTIATAYGHPRDGLIGLPLVYQHETVGELLFAPRAPKEPLDVADHRLLADVARQAGIAAHAVQLTSDLQRSRERLVVAQEEERRRLRRDLHDGLGPALSGVLLRIGAARRVLPTGSAAESLLAEAGVDLRASVAEVRRLVYDLRPPALDQLGLVHAIREQAERYGAARETDDGPGLRVEVHAPGNLPLLSAAVEVAAYRIAQEALANAARHARARTCTVLLALRGPIRPVAPDNGHRNRRSVPAAPENPVLCLEIVDDGVGLPTAPRAGVGLISMRERAAELGGTCIVDRGPNGGTRVVAQLPLTKTSAAAGQRAAADDSLEVIPDSDGDSSLLRGAR